MTEVLAGESPVSHSPDLKDEAKIGHLEKLDSPAVSEVLGIDPALDRAITRKFDTRVIPWLFGVWLLAFIDRSNAGNAKLDGLTTDLNLDGTKFNVALTVFYITYIVVDVPSNLAIKYVGAGLYIPGLLIGWGIIGMATGFTKSYGGLIACRLLLGMFEGGLLGGLVLYLSMFYRRQQLILRIGLFYCAAPLSGAFGGLLATGLAEINHGGYNGWPWIFIVEGVITILYGFLVIFILPNTPAEAKFLSEAEREGALARIKLDYHGATSAADVAQETFSWKWVRMAVFNINTMLCSWNFFAIITPIYSFSLFLPTIISGLGYTKVTAQLFTVPPNVVACLAVIGATYTSAHFNMRGPVMIIGCTMAIVGYIMLLASHRPAVQYGGTFLIGTGVFPSATAVMAWLSNNLAPHYTRATGLGIQIGIANLAAFIATFTYISADAPRYVAGHCINIGMLTLSLCFSTATILYVKSENRKRDRGERDHRLDEGNVADLGYRHPNFRYSI